MLVRSHLELTEDGAEDVRLDYLLHELDGQWRIINVIANGVSDLSLKRADYDVTVKNEGFDVLVTKLNAQVADYEKSE
jgi:phospholipid transport system substrate-binding protein